ncbi:MAG: hypothetical protein KME04_07740 [Pleurocapsa minor GSE-CHR-MK-17-07R]|nr:hypothetical protein [Pleurocapsa minor GSE-CHR-MK 17-07R]
MFERTFRNRLWGVWLLILLLLMVQSAAYGQQSVVYGVFFYSPTCPHCHDVIENHWPGIQEEFGEQLQVLFVDVSQRQGSAIMGTSLRAMNISSNGVPMLIIGSEVMVGAFDIPQRAPDVIRTGLAGGGIGFPPVPGIDQVFEAASVNNLEAGANSTVSANFENDPANTVAVAVLIGLMLSLGVMLAAGWSALQRGGGKLIGLLNGAAGKWVVLVASLGGIGLSLSLLAGSFNDVAVSVLAAVIGVCFVVLLVLMLRTAALPQLPTSTIMVITVAGILVAGYLAHVEVTLSEAVCGVVGDCNAVQQSPYARIGGIPVGVLGIVGYLVISGLWLFRQVRPSAWIDAALFASALLGVGFSIYLTFLEPFVIGASCVWCLTSAVLMLLLLWVSAPPGWDALKVLSQVQKSRARAA